MLIISQDGDQGTENSFMACEEVVFISLWI